MNFKTLFFILILVSAQAASAKISILPENETRNYLGEPQWDSFSKFVNEEAERERQMGTAYLVSGALALVGGTIGYHRSVDPFAQTVFTITQSMGIAALGYGAWVTVIGNENRGFYNAVSSTTSLDSNQRDELLKNYLYEKNEDRRKTKFIRIFTHGLIAAVNFYNGSRQPDPNLRSLHYIVGGVNAVWAVSIAF